MTLSQADIRTFWSHVAKAGEDECWQWTASVNHNGYGHGYCDGKTARAHRICWLIHNGPIPDGLKVLHTCDNRGCCNPKHLWLGTAQDNIDDMKAKGREYHPKGSEHQFATRHENDVAEMKRRLASGETCSDVAAQFGLKRSYLYQIAKGQKWKHVLPELTQIIRDKIKANYLTEDQIKEIKYLWAVDGVSQSDIARKFQVSPPTVCRILKGIQRGHRVLSYA